MEKAEVSPPTRLRWRCAAQNGPLLLNPFRVLILTRGGEALAGSRGPEGRGNDGKFFSLNDVPLRVRVCFILGEYLWQLQLFRASLLVKLSRYKAELSCVFSLLSPKPVDDAWEPSIQAAVISSSAANSYLRGASVGPPAALGAPDMKNLCCSS